MGPDNNPYQAPQAEVTGVESRGPTTTGGQQLAGRGQRLAAAMLDGAIMMAILLPLAWATGVLDDLEAFANRPFVDTLGSSAVGFGLGLLVQGYFLATRAQTIGKLALGIKIVTLDGQNATFGRIVLLRMLPMGLLSMIPFIGNWVSIADSAMIFQEDHRCLHDHIAGTRVVRV